MDDHRQRESLSFEKVVKKKKRSKYRSWSLDNPLLVGSYIALIAFCVVMVIGGNIGSHDTDIERADIGTIAVHDYKASRDFTFDRVDKEATDKIREQRVSEVLPIFRWDKNYHDQTLNRMRNAFELMQNGLAQETEKLLAQRILRENAGKLAQPNPERQVWADALLGRHLESSVFDEYVSTRSLTAEEIELAIKTWCHANRDKFVQALGYSVSNPLYEWLISQRFAEPIEEGLLQIFDVVLGRMIVSTRQEIDEINAFNVHWFEAGEKRQRKIETSEKSAISSLSASESLTQTLLREKFQDAPDVFINYFLQFVRPNIEFDASATQRERQNVSDKTAELRVIEEYKKGQTIVERGNPIKPVHFEIFEKMSQNQGDTENRTGHWLALFTAISVMGYLMWRSMRAETGRRKKNRDVMFFATQILVFAIFLKLFSLVSNVLDSVYHLPFSMMLLFPFASAPMVMRIVINRQYAYLFSVCALIVAGLILEDTSIIMPYAVVSTMAGCLLIERPKRSNVVWQRGLLIGLISALMAVSIYLLRGTNLTQLDYSYVFLCGFASGLISSGVVMIGLPLAESIFGYVTSNKLLELSNLEHPALKTLFLEAPGTYQHSIMVGQLNEAAADAIGANAILARVGGYYHDIGKAKNAQYFAENQRGDNPHNRLKPNMSALILKAHERDGLDIARKYKLPQDIMDFIVTHHGTSRIEYFYQRAKEQQERVHEDDYRYPGPRPQTRETGICMVSDMVEAAVRSLPDKSPDRILVLVHKLINHKFTDGQFSECDLTLRDLNDIANAQIGILNAFYHHRPEYPDQKKERERLEAEKRAKAESEKKTDADKKQENTSKDAADKTDLPSSDEIKSETTPNSTETLNKSADKAEKQDKSAKENKNNKTDKQDKSGKNSKTDKQTASDKETPETPQDANAEDTSDALTASSDPKIAHETSAVTTEKKETSAKSTDKTEKTSKNKTGKSDKTPKSEPIADGIVQEQVQSPQTAESEDVFKYDATAETQTNTKNLDQEPSAAKAHVKNTEKKQILETFEQNTELSAEEQMQIERDEADALLKEDEDTAAVPADKPSEPSRDLSIHETYELSFSSQVDVFKKN